jgi:exodeoxyribonuclease-3
MQLATWNVNSIRARLPKVLGWVQRRRPDVLCLQEIKCLDEQFPRAEFEAEGYAVETFGQKTYNGVAILSRAPLADVARGFPGGEEAGARVLAATVGGVRVLDAYVVNGQEVGHAKYALKLRWLEALAAHVRGELLRHPSLALVGDFNVTFDDRDVHDPEAWRERILCSTPEREALGRVLAPGLSDAFRAHCAEGGHYTWWDFRTRGFLGNRGLRIDHVLLSAAALARCRGVEIDVEARKGEAPSDHAPVIATLE